MTIVSTVELRNNFAALVDQAFAGEEVVIEYTKGRKLRLLAIQEEEQYPKYSAKAIFKYFNDPVLREKIDRYKKEESEFDGSMDPREEKMRMRELRYKKYEK